MNVAALRLLVAAAVFAAPSLSQVRSIVGPPVAPVGCPVQISYSNDTPTAVEHGPILFTILDAGLNLVYPALGPMIPQFSVETGPGRTFTTNWPQIDLLGNQVPPGDYTIFVRVPTGSLESHVVRISTTAQAAVAPRGVPRIGTARNYELCSPNDPNELYLLMASGANAVGIPTCAGVVPLDLDPLLLASLGGSPVFSGWFGQLDGNGASRDPAFALPQLPALVGLDYVLAFVVLNQQPGCFLRTISEPTPLTVQ